MNKNSWSIEVPSISHGMACAWQSRISIYNSWELNWLVCALAIFANDLEAFSTGRSSRLYENMYTHVHVYIHIQTYI